MAKLLAFSVPADRLFRLSMLCASIGAEFEPVPPERCGETLGALAAGSGGARGAKPLPEEMLVMAGFPDAMIDALLDGWRKAGLAPVRLKAVLTPTNAAWTPARLQAELLREDRMMRGPSRKTNDPGR